MIKTWIFIALLVLMLLISGGLLAEERIQLDDTSILGSRELPKVTYIVPWKSSKITGVGDLGNNSSYEEGMVALDRDIFRKELDYFNMLQGTGTQSQP